MPSSLAGLFTDIRVIGSIISYPEQPRDFLPFLRSHADMLSDIPFIGLAETARLMNYSLHHHLYLVVSLFVTQLPFY